MIKYIHNNMIQKDKKLETTLHGFLTENMFKKAKQKEKETDYQIMMDMDGVVCDFDKQLKQMFLDKYNKENETTFKTGWDFEDEYGPEKFWKEINKLGIKFWSEMPWTKDGRKLWNFVKQFDNTEVLTKPSKDKLSRDGKKIWCKEELGDVKVNFSYNKEQLAKPNRILIDDLEKNIDPWIKAGGIGILHKNTEDTIKKLKKYFNI